MSRENVELLRAATEAMVRGDAVAALDALDPEVEWHATVGGVDEGRSAHGREEVAQAFADYFETWERIELRAERFIDAADDQVVVFWHEVAKGRASGAIVETDTGTVNTVRNGKIAEVRSFMERDDAMRAAGVSGVDLVLDGYSRFNAGETRPEPWFWHENAEYHASQEDPDAAVHRGIDAIRRQYANWLDAYPDLKVEPVEARGNGNVVFVWVRFHGHGAGSGMPMEMELAHVVTVRDGKAERLVEYFDRAEGLRAAGLSE